MKKLYNTASGSPLKISEIREQKTLKKWDSAGLESYVFPILNGKIAE